jgi:hypothetical protein
MVTLMMFAANSPLCALPAALVLPCSCQHFKFLLPVAWPPLVAHCLLVHVLSRLPRYAGCIVLPNWGSNKVDVKASQMAWFLLKMLCYWFALLVQDVVWVRVQGNAGD